MLVHPAEDSSNELQRLRQAVRRDPLTGAANRLELDDRLRENLAAFDRDDVPFAVLFLDVDDFKRINDRRGHSAGDATLIRLAATLRQESEPADLVARYGGDEFLIVRPACDAKTAVSHAERLRSVVETTFGSDSVTVSIGVAVVQPDDSVDAVLQRADRALYRAKRAGRNRIGLSPAADSP